VEGSKDILLRRTRGVEGRNEEQGIVITNGNRSKNEASDEGFSGGSTGGADRETIEALEKVEGHKSEELDEEKAFDTGGFFEEEGTQANRSLPLVVSGFDVVLFLEGGEDVIG